MNDERLAPTRETRLPASVRACDAFVLAFALWTLACNAVTLLGGGFRAVPWTALALAACAAVLWRRRPRPAAARGDELPAAPAAPQEVRLWRAAAATCVALCIASAVTGSAMLLWWGGLAPLGAAAALALRRATPTRPPRRAQSREAALWALSVLGAAIPLLFQRHNIDDTFYLNVAVAALDRPDLPLLRFDSMFGIEGLPLLLPVYRVSSFELLGSLVARVLSLSAIQACHWVLPAVFGALVPLAHARLFRLLTPESWLWSAAIALVVLLSQGEPQRSYGNFAFVLLHQGKGVFLTAMVPLLVAYALEFGQRPSAGRWIRLAAAQVAALGTTSTAIWAAPALATLALASALPLSTRALRTLAFGVAAGAYPLAAGLALRGEAVDALAPLDAGLGATALLRGAWEALFGTVRLAALAPLVAFCTWTLCRTAPARRLASLLPFGFLLLFANPYLAPFTAANVTGEISFFRIFWVLPVPVFLTLVLVAPLSARRPARPAARLLVSALLTAGFAVWCSGFATLSPANGVRFEPLGLKVPPLEYEAAAALVARTPARSRVLAPDEVANWVGTFPRHPYALVPRDVYLDIVRPRIGQEEYALRFKIAGAMSRAPRGEEYFDALRLGLERYGIAGVCLKIGLWNAPRIRGILRERFELAWSNGSYEVWVARPGSAGRARSPARLGSELIGRRTGRASHPQGQSPGPRGAARLSRARPAGRPRRGASRSRPRAA